ncbi:hypothetical protein C0993_000725 [Termitomyces sp. T159_Od127]|nr:hypothetical protein C0993_000725 [Termitomyces sp. T159_Od127]
MPLTTIQRRIDAFEALSSPSSPSRRPPGPPSPSRKPQCPPSPPASLIDLHDWVVAAPPLPPRRSSVPLDSHTYPPLKPDLDVPSLRHAPASSISSFHSVSLSSDTDPASSVDPDSVSLDESFEQVSIAALPAPPKLPQRPPAPAPASASPSRRPPPPPPSRSSDRSSIRSTATSFSVSSASHLKVKRPTPVPPAARVRYDAVFDANVRQSRSAKQPPALLSPEQARGTHRRAAGWRGLSVDLITGAQDVSPPDDDSVVAPSDKLEGRFVKPIWRRSRLGRKTLAEIWNECDPDRTGALTRDQFAKGMWRIDEELRRAQVQALKPTSNGSLRSAFRPPPPVPKTKPILR